MKKNENIYRTSAANPEECRLSKKRPFNKSYTILPTLASSAQGAIPKQPDDIKKNNSKQVLQNLDVEKSPCCSKLLKKDDQLARELSSHPTNKKYYQIAADESPKAEPAERVDEDHKETGVDCNKIFLVGEEFIDDEYDSYMNGLDESSGYSQVLENTELYEVSIFLLEFFS